MTSETSPRSKRVPWREGRVISIALRDEWFARLQMLRRPFVAVFSEFRCEDDWADIELTSSNHLFDCSVNRSILKRSQVHFHKGLAPAPDIQLPEWKINTRGFRNITLWAGTKEERTVMVSGGEGNVGLWRSFCEPGHVGDEYIPISTTDYDRYTEIELAHVRDYPEFNERLFLCSELECNFDPLKELVFDRSIDPMCSNYVNIISGKRFSECGY